MGKKLAPKLAPNVVPKHGNGRLLPGGQPGHRGGGGRPPTSYREWVTAALNSQECRAQVLAILHDSGHPAFSSVFGRLLPYAAGSFDEPSTVNQPEEWIVVLENAADRS
jgi:hypothetical protein